MITLESCLGLQLSWRQPSVWARRYELRGNQSVVATATAVPKTGMIVDFEDGQVTVRRGGVDPRVPFWKRAPGWRPIGIAVVDEQTGEEVARIPIGFGERVLKSAAGARYRRTVGFWMTTSSWVPAEGNAPLVSYSSTALSLRSSGKVVIHQLPVERGDLRALVVAGWWLAVQYH
ncbi:MAG: hypothetical protein ACSLFQ_23100 [Thermoanaerobaculia bacterium]